MGLLSLGAGVAIGYVIGTKTTRADVERGLEKVRRTAEDTWNDPKVQDFVKKTEQTANEVAHEVAERSKAAAAAASEAMKNRAEEAEETVASTAETVKETADDAAERVADAADTAADSSEGSDRA